jgi:hypothetical protein
MPTVTTNMVEGGAAPPGRRLLGWGGCLTCASLVNTYIVIHMSTF